MAAGSGVLYGAINVLVKRIDAHPFAMGAIAYLASCLVLSPFLRGLRIAPADRVKVLTMGLVGGGLAPAFLFLGLREASAVDTSLLLTMEMVATAVLATLFLSERFRGSDLLGLLCLLAAAAAIALAAGRGGTATTPRGALLVLAAAVAWGVDNTVSARLVGAYRPPQLIAVKGLLGGLASLTALFVVRAPLPSPTDGLALAAIGVVSVGVSSLLFYHALGRVGAARTSAMNIATTALVGAFGGALLLHEVLGPLHAVAVSLVLAGAFLLARSKPS